MVFSWRQFCLALTRAVKPGTKRKIQGMIAKSFAAEVEKLHGAKSAANSPSAKTKLVEAKLDVVRAGWLLQHVGIVGRLCCFDRVDRVQRDEIHRRLQRRFDPGPGAPFCNRGSRIADQRGISSLWKYERERRIRGSEPVDSHFRPKWKRDHLRGSNQVARSMELFGSHRRDHKNASAYRPSPQPRSSRFAVTTPLQAATKKLPVSAILFGILAGIIGIAAGLFLGFALGAALAAAFHISTFEGGGLFCRCNRTHRDVHRRAGRDSSDALLARHKRTLAFRRVDNRLHFPWYHCGVRIWNLVCRSTACFEHQWTAAATGVRSKTAIR